MSRHLFTPGQDSGYEVMTSSVGYPTITEYPKSARITSIVLEHRVTLVLSSRSQGPEIRFG